MSIGKRIKYIVEFITFEIYLKSLEDKISKLEKEKRKIIDELTKSASEHDASSDGYQSFFRRLRLEGDEDYSAASSVSDDQINLIVQQAKIRLYRRLILLLLIFAICVLVQFIYPEIGRDVQVEYYSSVAQLYPVLLIASYLSIPPVKDSPHIHLLRFIGPKFTSFFLTFVGVAVSLIVVARGESDTASLLISVITLVFMTRVLLVEIFKRF